MITSGRKAHLINQCRLIMVGIPPKLGKQSKTQVIINRIESISHGQEEFQYCVDAISEMVRQTKGAEVEIYQNGRLIDKQEMSEKLERYGLEFNNQIKKEKPEN